MKTFSMIGIVALFVMLAGCGESAPVTSQSAEAKPTVTAPADGQATQSSQQTTEKNSKTVGAMQPD